jgi:hypothetical protein
MPPPGVLGQESGKGSAPGVGLSGKAQEHVGRKHRSVGLASLGIEMTGGVVHRMGEVVARNVAGGRELEGRGVARGRLSGHGVKTS